MKMNSHSRVYKCNFIGCKWDNIVDLEKAINFNNRYYHKWCLIEKENLKRIRELCFEIDSTTVARQLNKFLNNVVNIRKIETDYILFVLDYIMENDLEVSLPWGLIYKLNDYKIKDAYKTQITKNPAITIHSS